MIPLQMVVESHSAEHYKGHLKLGELPWFQKLPLIAVIARSRVYSD